MPYELYQFGSLVLPEYNGDEDVSTGQVAPVFLDLPGGGVFDVLGTDPAKRRTTPLNKVCTLLATDSAALRTAYNLLRAKIGRRDRLWRRWDAGQYDWCWARLVNIAARHPHGNCLQQDVDLQFVMISPHWYGQHHGGTWVFDAGVLFDTGYELNANETVQFLGDGADHSFVITNDGNRTVTNAVITVTGGGDALYDLSDLTIKIAGICELTYDLVPYDGTLTIDCGALAVLIGTAGLYDGFALGTTHACDDWLRLEPGANTIVVSGTSESQIHDLLIQFFDGWE